MPTPTHTRPKCAAALSDLVLKAARAAIPANVDSLMPLPDCGPLNKPLLPLLVALLDAAKVTATAVADNAWDSGQPIPAELRQELESVVAEIQVTMEHFLSFRHGPGAANAPTN